MLINSMNTTGKMNSESNESSRTTAKTIGDEGHTSNVSRHEESSDALSMDDGQKSVQHSADETNVGQSEVETKDNARADGSSGQSGKTGKKKDGKQKHCTEGCKVKNSDNMVRCCVCAHWYHMKCLKLSEADISGVWPCFKCRNMARDIRNANDKIDVLTELVQTLVTSMEGNSDNLRTIKSQYAQMEDDNKLLKRKNEALETEVKELKRRLNSAEHQTSTAKKTLILGSSLIRNLDEHKLHDTDVLCLRGAKVADLAKELEMVRSSPRTYSRILLLGGGNDASQDEEHVDLEQAISQCKTMVNTAKEICDNVCIVAIPPRLQPTHANENIMTLNANLLALAQETEVHFIDNPKSLFLSNGEVNDGYLYDNVHLNIKGANKLAHSMGLKGNNKNAMDMCSVNACQSSPVSWTNKKVDTQRSTSQQKTRHALGNGSRNADHGSGTGATKNSDTTANSKAATPNDSFDAPFWARARGKVKRHTRKETSYAQVTRSENRVMPDYCLYCGEENHATNQCRHRKKSNVMTVKGLVTRVNFATCIETMARKIGHGWKLNLIGMHPTLW